MKLYLSVLQFFFNVVQTQTFLSRRANVAKTSRERRKPVATCRAYVAKSARDRRKGIARHTGNATIIIRKLARAQTRKRAQGVVERWLVITSESEATNISSG